MSAIEDYQSLEQLSEDIALNRERCHNDPRKFSNIHNSRPDIGRTVSQQKTVELYACLKSKQVAL